MIVCDFSQKSSIYKKLYKKQKRLTAKAINLYSMKCVRDEIRTHTAARPLPPQSSVSTNSTTRTSINLWIETAKKLERKTGLEPATPTLARLCSTNWAIFAILISFQRLTYFIVLFERKTGLEPATPTLARLCSTNWAIFAIAMQR